MQKIIDHPCESTLRDRRWGDEKGRLAEAGADSVDGVQEAWSANQSGLKDALAGKVDKGQTDQHGQNPLAGQKKHEKPSKQEDRTKCILH